MSMMLQKKGAVPDAPSKANVKEGASKAKAIVTPGAGFDVQAKQLAPAHEKKPAKGLSQGELTEWLEIADNIIRIKPEGSPEAYEHIAAGKAMVARASASQAKVLQQKLAKVESVLSSDMLGSQ